MSEELFGALWGLLAVVIITGSFIAGCSEGEKSGFNKALLKHKKDAVNHGAAEYILNPTTGETKWQWKNQPKEEAK